MSKQKIINFLNREWERVKREPSKIKEFYKKHGNLIDTITYEATVGSLLLSGLNLEILFPIQIAGLGVLGGKWARAEKELYGGSVWQAGMKRRERLEEVI
jgi:hypothetical protein